MRHASCATRRLVIVCFRRVVGQEAGRFRAIHEHNPINPMTPGSLALPV
jgi:hypothetical protein